MPLKSGYSYGVVAQNIAEMLRTQHSRDSAVAAAYALARRTFFKRFPQGAIPTWLAFPKNCRLREHYDVRGVPVRENPRNVDDNEKHAARALFEGFTGRPARGKGRTIKLPPQPRAGVVMGQVIQVGYQSVRDGKPYRHTFRSRSRPLLVASSDGKQALIVGGRFVVTDRGIEDR